MSWLSPSSNEEPPSSNQDSEPSTDAAPAADVSAASFAAFRRWVHALCIIKFDLEQGQMIESSYPPNSISSSLEPEVAFNSFPDSISQNQYHRASVQDSIFFFRARGAAVGGGYLYGYVFNRQRHDERLRRGGEQKSVVILSPHPYSSVFRPLLRILGPLCFDLGPRALELVATHIASWPAPSPGAPMDLPIAAVTLKAHLPPSDTADCSSIAAPNHTNPALPQGLFHEADLFGIFRGVLLQLWLLWELAIVGEPVLIIAPTPTQCSEAVAGIVSLVAPLPCNLDFRPYFTIHDPDFARLNALSEGDYFPPMLLGVTNLFFLKAFRNAPHILSVGCPNPNSIKATAPAPQAVRSVSAGRPGRPARLSLSQLNRFSPLGILTAIKSRRDGPLCLMTEHKEAIWTTYQAVTKPDTSVLNRLMDDGMSPRVEESVSIVNNEILRRHFLELTANFLAPFGPYLRVASPPEGFSLYAEPYPLPPFRDDEFLKSLAARGPGKFLSKRLRANWLDLYKRFLSGKNFMPWFQKRRAAAEQEQHRVWRQARLNADIQKSIVMMSEVEIVDSFNAIERHLLAEIRAQQSGKDSSKSLAACQKLKGDLQAVYNVLPKDTQQLLLANPQRATRLQELLDNWK